MSRDPVVRAMRKVAVRQAQAGQDSVAESIQVKSVPLRKYPAFPQPYADNGSQLRTLEALKEAIEQLLRARGDPEQSAVLVGELAALGLIRILPNGLVDMPILAQIDEWRSKSPHHDWVPDTDDQWIGDADEHPRGVAVGVPSGDQDLPGIKGVFLERSGASDGGGGAVIMGFVGDSVRAANGDPIPDPGEQANAPLEVAGAPVLLMGGTVIEVGAPLTEEHYLILGESVQLADGRHVAPLQLGPRYVPAFEDAFVDSTTDVELSLGPATLLADSTLTNAYAVGDSTFGYQITITEESGNRQSIITIEVWVNTGGGYTLAQTDDYPMSASGRLNVDFSVPVTNNLAVGNQVELRVSAVLLHPQADPWVRSTLRPTVIQVKQG